MAAKGTLILAIGTEHLTDTDILAQVTKAPSGEPQTGLNDLINLLARLASGTEEGRVRVAVQDGDTGATVFTAASLTTLRNYARGV